MKEKEVHDLIIHDNNIKNDILKIISLKINKGLFIHEDKYINGIIADFTVLYDKKIVSIIECKGSDLNVTEYVRGIGQVLQYQYFCENNISPKGYKYDIDFVPVLLFPSSVLINSKFNIANFKYPSNLLLIELNENSKVVRKISKLELEKLRKSNNEALVTISQYYFRDNRIIELFLLLKYLSYLKFQGKEKVDRKRSETNFLRKLNTINNNNWRNAFISLSSLGLIDSNNLPTKKGIFLASLKYEEFASEIFLGYIKPYIECIFELFETYPETLNFSNLEISHIIKSRHNNKDILFLTESKGRYMSSWLSILRDDYGCISFSSKNKKRKIIYNPCNFNKLNLIKKIKEHTAYYEDYIKRYYKIINGGL